MKTRWLSSFSMFAVLVVTAASAAGAEPKCFPTCRSGYVCSPQGQCVSACNPPCGSDQTCTEQGECVARPSASGTPKSDEKPKDEPLKTVSAVKKDEAPAEQQPHRPLELTLGIGGQKVLGSNDSWGVTPELAFDYAFNPDRPVEFFIGARARYNTKFDLAGIGTEVGLRGGIASADRFVKGGFFLALRPELLLGKITHPEFQVAVSGGVALGPYLDVGPVVVRIPIAVQGVYTTDTSGADHSAGLISVTGEAGIRF